MGKIHWAVASGATAVDLPFGGLTTTPNPHYHRRKIGLCACHCPNYFARLVPAIGLFTNVWGRTWKLVWEYYYVTIVSNIICDHC